MSIERYWNPSTTIIERSAEDTIAQLDALLAEVIPQHTVSDVPVGVFLSGGIDSALTTYYLDAPRTYTLGIRVGRPFRGGCGAASRRTPRYRAFGNDGAASGFCRRAGPDAVDVR